MARQRKWYRNCEGYPMVTLRETMLSKQHIGSSRYDSEIKDLVRVLDIKQFYESCRGFDTTTLNFQPLKNNAFSDEVLDAITTNKFTIVVKERQIGFSTIEAVIALYYTQMLCKCVVVIGNDNMMSRIKTIYVMLPDHLKFGIKKLTKKCIKFNNGTFIRSEEKHVSYSPDLIMYDEYDFLPSRRFREFISKIAPSISARVGDQLLIGSTLGTKKTEGSLTDLLTNSVYGVYNFQTLDLTKIEILKKQFDRNNKINNILDI